MRPWVLKWVCLVLAGLLVGLSLQESLWPRLLINLGHLHLSRFSMSAEGTGDVTELRDADRFFSNAQTWSSSIRILPWRFSYTRFVLKDYEAAATAFALTESQERPEYLLNEQSGGYHVLGAILAERAQDWSLALFEYRTALALSPRPWELTLYQRYYQALAHSSDSKEQEIAKEILGFIESLTALEPTGIPIDNWAGDDQLLYPVDDPPVGCWMLSGFRYDQPALEYGPLVPMQLVWRRAATEAGMNSKDSSLIDGRSVQSILGINLAPNAGFEWDGRTGTYYPLGYTESIYQDSLSNHVLLAERRAGRFTTVASLRNDPLHIYSSYISRTIPVRRDVAYLQAGWMRSEGGLAYLGRHWMDNELNSTPLYEYVKGTVSAREWKLYASLVRPPPAASGAVLWLLNFDAAGNAYFDDLLFVPLQIPPC